MYAETRDDDMVTLRTVHSYIAQYSTARNIKTNEIQYF